MFHAPMTPRVRPSPHARLRRLLGARIAPSLVITESRARDWASANFCGERHCFDCQATGAFRTSDLRAALADAEWRMPGHIVADVTVEEGDKSPAGRTLVIEILTVVD